jgi:hypothetical protein
VGVLSGWTLVPAWVHLYRPGRGGGHWNGCFPAARQQLRQHHRQEFLILT